MPQSQFKGLKIAERKQLRRQKLIQAGIDSYGKSGFFAVTVKDICIAAHLTERYFYESFKKSDELFQCIFLMLSQELQHNIMTAIEAETDAETMLNAGLLAFLNTLKNNPNMARIIYIDAMLVQELHYQADIRKIMQRFEEIVKKLVMELHPNSAFSPRELSWMTTGINGYVTHSAIRWVMSDFKPDLKTVLASCRMGFRNLAPM